MRLSVPAEYRMSAFFSRMLDRLEAQAAVRSKAVAQRRMDFRI
jgi:hypothetical protein